MTGGTGRAEPVAMRILVARGARIEDQRLVLRHRLAFGVVRERQARRQVAFRTFDLGVPAGWHPHGNRAQILADLGLTAQDVAREVTGWLSRLDAEAGEAVLPR